jgi:hypothetical protein
LDKLRLRFESKYQRGAPDECWEWLACRNPQGYGKIWAIIEGRHEQLAHRLAYRLEYGDIPDDLCVCHSCDNPPCVNPRHLWLGTVTDNGRDCDDKGRRIGRPGLSRARHPMTRFSEADVADMVARYVGGETQAAIGARYGTTQNVISKIVRRTLKG